MCVLFELLIALMMEAVSNPKRQSTSTRLQGVISQVSKLVAVRTRKRTLQILK
jgi:hypothetical protein